MSKNKDPFFERESQRYENPIPSREYILSVILEADAPCSHEFLMKHFKLKGEEANEALRRRLNAMLRDSQLGKHKAGYSPLTLLNEVQGELSIHRDGVGYVIVEGDEPIKILAKDLRGYYDKDILRVRIIRYDYAGEPLGEVVSLVVAATVQMVGRLVCESEQNWFIPLERKYTQDILISSDVGHLTDGAIIVIKLNRLNTDNRAEALTGEVIEVLGDPQTQGIEIKMAVRQFQLPENFPPAVQAESKKYPKALSEASKEGCVDLTQLNFVTIDGEDAKDFDDAVYCTPSVEGFTLYVAIADVSYYVQPGSPLDEEAKHRGTSVYFPGYVIPMLPEYLSNGLCSLKPKVERLSVVCEMLLTPEGKIKRAKFYRAVICSCARLTYTEVANMLEGKKVLKKYEPIFPDITHLHEVYKLLRTQRNLRGAIDFETVETYILFDKLGKIDTIIPKTRNIAHKIIEECMLAANVVTARFLLQHKMPTLYRNHNAPTLEKLKAVREFLGEFKLDLKGGDTPSPGNYATLMQQIEDREDKHIIETVLLRSLSQADYSPRNEGHFGLAYSSYLHFTSPIRRYPDLLVHRQIINVLTNKPLEHINELKVGLEQLGLHCSTTERRADEATRQATVALKCHFMLDKVGQNFIGRITGVTSFGFFVELESLYIDGLVHVATLGDDYFIYEPFKHRMIGEHTREVFKLGDLLEVKLVKVDVDDRKIDLQVVRKSVENSAEATNQSNNQSNNKSIQPSTLKKEKAKKSRAKKPRKKSNAVKNKKNQE